MFILGLSIPAWIWILAPSFGVLATLFAYLAGESEHAVRKRGWSFALTICVIGCIAAACADHSQGEDRFAEAELQRDTMKEELRASAQLLHVIRKNLARLDTTKLSDAQKEIVQDVSHHLAETEEKLRKKTNNDIEGLLKQFTLSVKIDSLAGLLGQQRSEMTKWYTTLQKWDTTTFPALQNACAVTAMGEMSKAWGYLGDYEEGIWTSPMVRLPDGSPLPDPSTLKNSRVVIASEALNMRSRRGMRGEIQGVTFAGQELFVLDVKSFHGRHWWGNVVFLNPRFQQRSTFADASFLNAYSSVR